MLASVILLLVVVAPAATELLGLVLHDLEVIAVPLRPEEPLVAVKCVVTVLSEKPSATITSIKTPIAALVSLALEQAPVVPPAAIATVRPAFITSRVAVTSISTETIAVFLLLWHKWLLVFLERFKRNIHSWDFRLLLDEWSRFLRVTERLFFDFSSVLWLVGDLRLINDLCRLLSLLLGEFLDELCRRLKELRHLRLHERHHWHSHGHLIHH